MKNYKETKKTIVVNEDWNMYGRAHCTNFDGAKRALETGKQLIIKCRAYDGSRYHYSTKFIDDLFVLKDGNICGYIRPSDDIGEREPWKATRKLCVFAETGKMFG